MSSYTHSKFKRSGQIIQDFDGEEASSSSSSEESQQGAVALPSSAQTSANHLLMVALLEHLCTLHVPEPKRSKKVFSSLCEQLATMKVMNPLVSIDELSSVRTQYRSFFAKMVQTAMSTISQDIQRISQVGLEERARLFLQPRLSKQLVINLSELIAFHSSRYRDEFDEVGRVGSGAYGSVFKARNKLDKAVYAVKKIAFQEESPELWLKTLREVKYLASVSHCRIVRYHNAWLEYQHQILAITENGEGGQDNFSVPEFSFEPPSTQNGAVVPYRREDSQDESIVFDYSTAGPSEAERNGGESGSEGSENSEIIQNIDAGEEFYGRSYVLLHIQMELCEQTLADWLKKRNHGISPKQDVYAVIDEAENLEVLQQILEGVDQIHSHNLIHRDLKPKNIFLSHRDDKIHVKIGDFGLTRRNSSSPTSQMPPSPLTPHPGLPGPRVDGSNVLLTGGVGTTIYAAPEQLAGNVYDKRSDMYSLGLVLMELYQPFRTEMERIHTLTDVRKGNFPAEFCTKWPCQAKWVKALTSLKIEDRPSCKQILESSLFRSPEKIIRNLQTKDTQQQLQIDELSKEAAQLRDSVHRQQLELRRKDEALLNKDKIISELQAQLENLRVKQTLEKLLQDT